MESDDINVHFSGYVLAEILNRANFSEKVETGLLHGDYQLESTESINDLTQDGISKTTSIIIQDSTKCSQTFSFYDQLGQICEERFVSVNNKREQQCVGFYCIRRNSRSAISLREKTIIQNLLKSNVFHRKRLLFFLMSPAHEKNKATCHVNYRSYICELINDDSDGGCSTQFTACKSDIINLGENFQSMYKHKSLLIPKKTDLSTKMMNMLQEYTADKFLTETGSVGLADSSYSMFYKTLCLVTNLQEELVSCNEEIDKYNDDIDVLEQCCKMDTM